MTTITSINNTYHRPKCKARATLFDRSLHFWSWNQIQGANKSNDAISNHSTKYKLGYDFGPLNRIMEYNGFRTITQWNPSGYDSGPSLNRIRADMISNHNSTESRNRRDSGPSLNKIWAYMISNHHSTESWNKRDFRPSLNGIQTEQGTGSLNRTLVDTQLWITQRNRVKG